jgi:UDP-N-acetylglucosamine 2-epimerase (hydrolysing)
VDVGSRQQGRFEHESIVKVGRTTDSILAGIKSALAMGNRVPTHHFGRGKSAERFLQILKTAELWRHPTQKVFVDVARPVQANCVQ